MLHLVRREDASATRKIEHEQTNQTGVISRFLPRSVSSSFSFSVPFSVFFFFSNSLFLSRSLCLVLSLPRALSLVLCVFLGAVFVEMGGWGDGPN